MSKDKFDELIKKYPKAFNSKYGDFYFECSDGWHDIIEPIIVEMQKYNEKQTDEFEMIYPMQVKEKFGTLRFYTNACVDEIDTLINKAEKTSHTVCETCGKPGELISARWLYTACPEHMKKGDRTYAKFVEERDSILCV
jgi:hypothetical protein